MKTFRLFLLTAVLATVAVAGMPNDADSRPGPQKGRPVTILNTWNGTLADAALRRHAPDEGFVLDPSRWAALWHAWRGKEKAPAVDFRKQMILVFTADGPNHVGCVPTLDSEGNVDANAMATLMGGPGFGYLIQCIGLEGVRSVNGRPLPGVKVLSGNSSSPATDEEPGDETRGEPGEEPGSTGAGEPDVTGGPPSGVRQPPPIKQLEKITPSPRVFEGSSWKEPLVLRSEEEAARTFGADEAAELTRQVDFHNQFILLFVWRGSGQDRLDAAVAESYPEQVLFSFTPGRTRDLREHVRGFALRSNVTWSLRSD